jgi:DNA-binding response OmpR family regulator
LQLVNAESTAAGPARASLGMVLVIDDEPGIRKFAMRVLETAGYQVAGAGDGQQGLDVFAQQGSGIAAVLVDLSMPGMDGRELTAELRRRAPDMPILMMSGYSDDEVAERLSGLGVVDFVHKPFRPADLIHRLATALARNPVAGEPR